MDPRFKPIERMAPINSPAVASGFTITPNTASGWLIRSLRFQLVTDANVADRAVMLSQTDGSNEYLRTAAVAVQAASLTRVYSAQPGTQAPGAVGTFIGIHAPADGFWLPNGHSLIVTIENVQAGDQISAIAGWRYEFPIGPRVSVWPFVTTLTEESE